MKLDLNKPMQWRDGRICDVPETKYIGKMDDGRLVFQASNSTALDNWPVWIDEREVDIYIENIPERVVRWYALLIPQGGYHTLEELQRDYPSAQAIRCEFEGERAVAVAIEEAT